MEEMDSSYRLKLRTEIGLRGLLEIIHPQHRESYGPDGVMGERGCKRWIVHTDSR